MCVYGILSAIYGLGMEDSQLHPLEAYKLRALQYNFAWEIGYLVTAALVKTSIGVAVIRIALQRRYLYTIYAMVIIAVLTCVTAVIWEFAACRPLASRWDSEVGSCVIPGYVPISFAVGGLTVITDAAYSIVPVFILRRSMMPPRIKYGLMVVLACGSLAAIVSLAKFPFVPYFVADDDYLCESI